MNTLAEKRANIMALQYKHSLFSNSLATAMSNGSCSECMLKKNAMITMLFDIINNYTVLDEEINNGAEITVTGAPTTSYLLSIYVGPTLLNKYSFGADVSLEDALIEVAAGINAIDGYSAEIIDGILYIYGNKEGDSYSNLITLTSDSDQITSTSVSLEDNLGLLLDKKNCLTTDEICTIRSYTLCFLNKNIK